MDTAHSVSFQTIQSSQNEQYGRKVLLLIIYRTTTSTLIEKREAEIFDICLSTLLKKTIISYHTLPAMYSDGSILKPNEEDPAKATGSSKKKKEMTHMYTIRDGRIWEH